MRFLITSLLFLFSLNLVAQEIKTPPRQLKEGAPGDVMTTNQAGVVHRRAAILVDTQFVTSYVAGDIVKVSTTGTMYRAVIAATYPFNVNDAAWFPVDTRLLAGEVQAFEADATALNAVVDSSAALRSAIPNLDVDVFSTIKEPSAEPNKFMYYDTLTNQKFERRPTSDSLVPMFTYENYFYNLGGVVDFQKAINELLANDSRVSVDVFGDSRTQNRREMVEYLVQAMGRKYGYAGYGFISTSAPGSAGSSNSGISTVGRSGDWTGIDATNYPINQNKRLTIDKYGKYSTTVGDSLMVYTGQVFEYPESYADSIAVIYTQRPGGGTFRFRYGEKRGARYIEAGNEVINTNGPLSIVTRMVFVGDQVIPFWSVRTLTTSTAGVEYLGFRHTDPSGIVYNNYSRSGSSARQHWLDIDPIAWPYFLGQDKPSLVISNWGTNEGDPSLHRIYQDSVYQIAQAQSPKVDFLNISVPQRASLPNIAGQQNFEFNINYENLILAKKYDAAVFNFSGLVNDRVRNTDFSDDGTHEDFSVRRILAETIAQGIAPIAVENTPTYKEEKVSLYFREEVNALLNNTRSIRIGVPIHYDIVSDTEIQLTVDVMSTFVGYAGNYKWGISALVSPTGSLIRTNERLLYANVDGPAYFRSGDTIAIEISPAFVQDDYLYFDIYNPATTSVPVYIAGEVVVSNAKSSDLTYLVQDRITKQYLTGQSYSSASTTPQTFPVVPEVKSFLTAGALTQAGNNTINGAGLSTSWTTNILTLDQAELVINQRSTRPPLTINGAGNGGLIITDTRAPMSLQLRMINGLGMYFGTTTNHNISFTKNNVVEAYFSGNWHLGGSTAASERLKVTGTTLLGGNSTIQGLLNMSSNRITSLATPTAGTDAANRDYVDSAQVTSQNYSDTTRQVKPDDLPSYKTGEVAKSKGYLWRAKKDNSEPVGIGPNWLQLSEQSMGNSLLEFKEVKTRAYEATQPVRVLFIGDSNTEGTGAAAYQLMRNMQQTYGPGGVGYVAPWTESSFYWSLMSVIKSAGWTEFGKNDIATNTDMSFLRKITSSTVGDTIRYQPNGAIPGDYHLFNEIKIYSLGNGASYEYKISDGSYTTVVLPNDGALHVQTIAPDATYKLRKEYTLTVRVLSGTVVHQGASFESYTGVRSSAIVNHFAVSGSRAKDYADINTARFIEGLQAIKADVVFIATSTNDQNANQPISEYYANLDSLSDRVERALGVPAIFVTGAVNQNDAASAIKMHEYAEASRQVAEANSGGVVNLYDVFSPNGNFNGEYYIDAVHYDVTAERMIADIFADVLQISVISSQRYSKWNFDVQSGDKVLIPKEDRLKVAIGIPRSGAAIGVDDPESLQIISPLGGQGISIVGDEAEYGIYARNHTTAADDAAGYFWNDTNGYGVHARARSGYSFWAEGTAGNGYLYGGSGNGRGLQVASTTIPMWFIDRSTTPGTIEESYRFENNFTSYTAGSGSSLGFFSRLNGGGDQRMARFNWKYTNTGTNVEFGLSVLGTGNTGSIATPQYTFGGGTSGVFTAPNIAATQGIDAGSNEITNVATPIATTDAANKAYVDAQVTAGGDNLGNHTATQDIIMGTNSITTTAGTYKTDFLDGTVRMRNKTNLLGDQVVLTPSILTSIQGGDIRGFEFHRNTNSIALIHGEGQVTATGMSDLPNAVPAVASTWVFNPDGSGQYRPDVLSATATLDFPSVANNASSDLTITVTGAAVGDPVSWGGPIPPTGDWYSVQVTAANTVTLRFNNQSGGVFDPPSATYKVRVFK